MATPSADHYMRQYTTAQLRAIVADPHHYGVGERLDADAILRDSAVGAASNLADALDTFEAALAAGVPIADLLAAQSRRHGV